MFASRKEFENLHRGYKPVPEVYLLSGEFDKFSPPQVYLGRLGLESTDLGSYLEALGCYIEPAGKDFHELNRCLKIKIPPERLREQPGIVLMCWDRIEALGKKWDDPACHLLQVVGFHEHSHAARASRLLKSHDAKVLQAEETVAQWETYMFLRSRKHRNCQEIIETMKKLMVEQPNCYRIPI